MPAGVRLAGKISAERLETAFRVVIGRHEILRTTFEDSNGELLQIISPSLAISTGKDNGQRQRIWPKKKKNCRNSCATSRKCRSTLPKDPLLRARLFELSPDDHVLLLTLHHILADGWSQSILQKELWAAYAAEDQSGDAGLPPLNIQYSDFAAWQKEWLASEESKEHREFWLSALKPPLARTGFPTDRPPQNRPASHGAIETILVAARTAASLQDVRAENHATMFHAHAGVLRALLAKYSGQEDAVVGSPGGQSNEARRNR